MMVNLVNILHFQSSENNECIPLNQEEQDMTFCEDGYNLDLIMLHIVLFLKKMNHIV